jgi:predicted dehydrogenase
MKRYSASVVGCGAGGNLSLAAYAASPRFELVAACDLKPEALAAVREKHPGIRTFASHREMFASCPTEVVSVSTFPPSHREVTLDALGHRPRGGLALPLRGILVEKPLADTAAAGREILRAIRVRGIPVVVPHSWLARDISQEIRARIRGGEIGRLLMMEVQCRRWDIINAGIHWIHFFLSVIEREPVDSVMAAVDATTRTYRDGMQVETSAVTYVEMKSGVRMVMQTGDDTATARGETIFRFYGSGGMIEWCLQEASYLLGGKSVPVTPRDPRKPHQRYLDHLAEQIDSGRFEFEIPDLSLTALEICEAAYVSAACRCRVVFPLESFRAPPPWDWAPGKPYSGAGGGRDGRALG